MYLVGRIRGYAVLISGPTGSGKSFLASALGHQGCQLGYKVSYFNMQKLIQQLILSRADGSIIKLLSKIAKSQLLILDDFGLKRSEEHTSELQSRGHLVCRILLDK